MTDPFIEPGFIEPGFFEGDGDAGEPRVVRSRAELSRLRTVATFRRLLVPASESATGLLAARPSSHSYSALGG